MEKGNSQVQRVGRLYRRSCRSGCFAYSNGTLVVSNRYDHLGRRVQKITPDGTHTFLCDGWRPVLETISRPGGLDRIEYHWGKDLSGTLDGAVVASYAYDAFGRTVAKSGTMADMFAIRYSTKYHDAEIGMYYYGKRFYLLALCRWLTRDPIEEEGGVNLYGFCGNNPLIRFDAEGEDWLSCFGSCVEEWRLDWSKIFTTLNVIAVLNAPVSKAGVEKLWIDKGVSKDTTELSRAISLGERLARKLPLGSPVRSKIIRGVGGLRRFMRNPLLVGAGAAGAALTVFEGFYDIGVMSYCSCHCCGK